MAKLTYADLIERDQRFRALANLGLRLDLVDATRLIPRLIQLVAAGHLNLLAESRSIWGIDGYWLAESDQARRNLIKGAYDLHQRKGTPWAIREIVKRLGFGTVEIIEGLNNRFHNGAISRNGHYRHGDPHAWAHYRVILSMPITNDQAVLLRQTLRSFAPARCVLASLDFTRAALRHNGRAVRDGLFNRGTA